MASSSLKLEQYICPITIEIGQYSLYINIIYMCVAILIDFVAAIHKLTIWMGQGIYVYFWGQYEYNTDWLFTRRQRE